LRFCTLRTTYASTTPGINTCCERELAREVNALVSPLDRTCSVLDLPPLFVLRTSPWSNAWVD
jgi:hypothetical protein